MANAAEAAVARRSSAPPAHLRPTFRSPAVTPQQYPAWASGGSLCRARGKPTVH